MPSIKNITKDATKTVEGVADETAKQTAAVRAEATRVATDPTPLYAAVGLTDTVVERARETVNETVARANKVGRALAPKNVGKTVSAKAGEVTKRAEALPGKAVSDVAEGLGKVQGAYQELAKRGEGLVGRVKGQQATKDLTKQVNTVVEQGKQLLGTASKGVTDTRGAAKSTVTKGRRQAAGVVADVVAGEDVTVSKKPTVSRKAATSRPAKPATRAAATTSTATTSASKPAAKSTATKSTSTKSASKPAATTSTATKSASKPAAKSTSTTSASKPAATSTATTSASATSASKPAATSTAATTDSKPAGTDKSTTTTAAAKRTATTARNAATKTVESAQDVVSETAKTAEKAVDATTAAASKTGN